MLQDFITNVLICTIITIITTLFLQKIDFITGVIYNK
jgi:hypothetical protein